MKLKTFLALFFIASITVAYAATMITGDIIYTGNVSFQSPVSVAGLKAQSLPDANFTGTIDVVANAGINGIVGSAINDLPANTPAFPTGTTGYGSVKNNGNFSFGLFGRSDCLAGLSNGLCIGQELNSFNYSGAPTTTFPINTSGSTLVPTAQQIVAYGTSPSTVGTNYALGSEPFFVNIYMTPHSYTGYGLYIDDDNVSSTTNNQINNYGNGVNLILKTTGPTVANADVLEVKNPSGTRVAYINQNGDFGSFGMIQTGVYTVATLPTCNTSNKGKFSSVSDANAPTYGATLAGGGAVAAIALCDGTNWKAH